MTEFVFGLHQLVLERLLMRPNPLKSTARIDHRVNYQADLNQIIELFEKIFNYEIKQHEIFLYS